MSNEKLKKPTGEETLEEVLEAIAQEYLSQSLALLKCDLAFPVPVERVVKEVCRRKIVWARFHGKMSRSFAVTDPDPGADTITFNDRFRDDFNLNSGFFRYTLAHELGHCVLHREESEVYRTKGVFGELSITTPDKRRRQQIEHEAEVFASYFLMPRELVLRAIQRYRINLMKYGDLRKLANKAGVSFTALIVRLDKLGLPRFVTREERANEKKRWLAEFECWNRKCEELSVRYDPSTSLARGGKLRSAVGSDPVKVIVPKPVALVHPSRLPDVVQMPLL
jgi:hypothetical protein